MLLMLLLWSCSDANHKDSIESPFYPPDQRGPNAVSTRVVPVQSRHGFELTTQVWYPTKETDDDRHVYGDIKESPEAQDDSEPDCSSIRPVLAFSHGNTAMRYQSYYFGEYLASHGYIVVAPDHVGNTFFDNDESRKPELILRRPEDISDAVNWLFESEEFKNCVDPEAGFAVSGHSFGGYTTIAISGAYVDTEATKAYCTYPTGTTWLCDAVENLALNYGGGIHSRQDDRVWGGISMTPAALETLIGGIASVSVPTMVLGGSKDTLTSMEMTVNPIFNKLTSSSRIKGEIIGAGHYSFSNACDLLPTYPDCGEDHLSSSAVHYRINTASVAYLGWLLGDDRMSEYLITEDSYLLWTDDR